MKGSEVFGFVQELDPLVYHNKSAFIAVWNMMLTLLEAKQGETAAAADAR